MTRRFLGGALLLVVLAGRAALLAATAKRTEAELLKMLGSSNPSTIIEALDRLPSGIPRHECGSDHQGSPEEPRGNRRAALALADYHAELALEEIRQVLGLLRSPDANEAMDGLKALRGLKERRPSRQGGRGDGAAA